MSPRAASSIDALRLLALAALAGAAVLVLEVAAPRLLAPTLGSGALTWIVTIATFLLGLALGSAAGGRWADRGGRALLPLLFLAAGLVTVATPFALGLLDRALRTLSLEARVLATVPLAFLPVSFALGALPPALARAMLAGGAGPGLRLGLVSAAGAIGSVGGALGAGFLLVPTWGLDAVFLGTALALGLAALMAVRGPLQRAPARAPVATMGSSARLLLFAFVVGFVTLSLEVLAGRYASDRLGASIYAWTSVIGVILSGLALGALLGGRLADRLAPARLLGFLLVGAAIAVAGVLWAPWWLSRADVWASQGALSLPTAILAATALAFLPASLLLGSLPPVLTRAALGRPETDGRVVGRLYALGTLGAVLGAILVGYVLIPLLGLERLTLLLAFVLASAAGAVRGRQPYLVYALLLLLALGVQGPSVEARRAALSLGLGEGGGSLVVEDSRHARIRVQEVEERSVYVHDGPDPLAVVGEPVLAFQGLYDPDVQRVFWRGEMSRAQRDRLLEMMPTQEGRLAVHRLYELAGHDQRRLRLDRLQHGFVDLQDPTWLGYGYERIYALVLDRLWPERPGPVSCFFIGGGAYAFQRYLLARHGDGIRCVTAEIDPRVTETAREWLGLGDDPRHDIVHEDARTWLARGNDAGGGTGEAFDLVFGDAFDHIAVPFHLTTREFDETLAARLAPSGVYLVNVLDTWSSGRFLAAFVTTLRSVLPHVRVVSALPRDDETRSAFVVVASRLPLDLPDGRLTGPSGETAWVHPTAEIDALVARAGAFVLTDDRAPVELLLAPALTSGRVRVVQPREP